MWDANKIKRYTYLFSAMLATTLFFACNAEEPLTLSTPIVSEVTDNAIHCSVTVDGAIPIDCGFYYATSKEEAEKISANKVRGTYLLNEISGIIEGLNPNTTYYVRGYAMNIRGKAYSETIEIKTATRAPESNDNEYPIIEL